MSFCNPNPNNLDDFFEEAPETNNDTTDRRYPAPTTAPTFNKLSSGNDGVNPDNAASKTDVISLDKQLRGAAKELQEASDFFNRMGLSSARLESALARLGKSSDNKFDVDNFLRDFDQIMANFGDLQNIIANGLGLENQAWYKGVKELQRKLEKPLAFVSRLGKLVRKYDNGGIDFTDQDLSMLVIDLANMITDITGSNTGLGKIVKNLALAVVGIQTALKIAQNTINALENSAIAALDIAEGLMSSALGMVAAICEFIPMLIAMFIAIYEMIKAVIMALFAVLADPLGALANFKLDIDWSKLFRMPPIHIFRRLKNRWANFTGTAFKLWTTVSAECNPSTWLSEGVNNPFKLSEAALTLGKATAFGASLATRAADAPMGIAAAQKQLDANSILNGATGALGFFDKSKSMLKIQPAKVNHTPASASLLGFMSGTTVPIDPSVFNLKSGLGALNPFKTSSTHSSGVPVAPSLQQAIANHLDVAADLTGTVRSAEVCATNSYEAGRNIKAALDPTASDEDVVKAVRRIMVANRRQRYIQPGSWDPNNGSLSLIAKDYFACEEKAVTSRFTITSMQEALNKLPQVFNQPPGLPGSIIDIAANNNPDAMVTSENNKGVSSTEGHLVVTHQTEKTEAYDGSNVPLSAEVQLTSTDLPTEIEISNPDDPILSASSENLDKLIAQMPLAAFPPTFHDSAQKAYILGTVTDTAASYQVLPMYMVCKDSSDLALLQELLLIEQTLKEVDIITAEGLYQKAFLQGLLDSNSFTWLAIGKKTLEALNTEKTMLDMLEGFIQHDRFNIKSLLVWLRSAQTQNILDPQLPLNLTEPERKLAELSYRFLQGRDRDLAEVFINLRLNADEAGGPMGYELAIFLVVDTILNKLETKYLDGIDVKANLERLKVLAERLSTYPALAQHIEALMI